MPLTAEEICERHEQAVTDRQNWESHWQDVADVTLPERQFTGQTIGGTKRRQRLYNGQAAIDAEELAANIHGLLTNPALTWFNLQMVDEHLNLIEDIALWLEDARNRMLRLFQSPVSGFSTTIHENYVDLVSFGFSCQMIRDEAQTLTFQAMPLASIWLVGNERDEVSEVHREASMTVAEVVNRWGEKAVSKQIRDLLSRKDKGDKAYREKVDILHVVYRRNSAEIDPDRMDGRNKRWASVYLEKKTKHILSESGFRDTPYLTPRWTKHAGEVYGRSPGMKILPDAQTVNAQAKTQLIAGEQAVRPPIFVPANSMEGPVRTAPGSILYGRPGVRERPEPLNLGTRPDIGQALIEHTEKKIDRGFFTDLFKLPDRDRMTAFEVAERLNQQLRLFSPVLSRLYQELLSPLVTRTYRAMRRRNLIPPPPASANGTSMKIEYVSPLALSQRASETVNFTRFMQTMLPLVQVDPSVMENLDADATFRWQASLQNVSPQVLRNRRDVTKRRAAIAQQQAFAAQAAAGKDAAAAAHSGAQALQLITGNGAA